MKRKSNLEKALDKASIGATHIVSSPETIKKMKAGGLPIEERFITYEELRGEAGEGGDWHDNAALDHYDQQTNLVSAQLARVQDQIKRVVIIQPLTRATHVAIGTEVVVEFGEDDRERFLILGPADSDPDKGVISYETPLARALMGKSPGEDASLIVEEPGSRNETKMRIINVKPGKF